MDRIPTITQGCDFTFRISARRIGYKNFVKVSFEEITNIVANLISLPSKKTAVSSSIDDAGRLIIPIDGQTLDCNMYGLELIGFYNNGNWRHQIAPAVEIVKSSAQDNYALVESDDLTIDIEITLGETNVSSRVLNTVIEEHNTNKTSHQDIRQEISDLAEDQLAMADRLDTAEQAINTHGQDIEQLKEDVQEAGNVDDVFLDGESILGSDKIARIDSSGFGHVDDVKVNGQSVLDPQTKTADIPVPTKVSELVNDSGFATASEAQTMADEAKITEAEVTVDDQVGTPSATASVVGHKLTLAFQNILGDGIENIEQTTTSQESGGVNIITVTTKGGKVATFQVKNGEKGDTVILDTENQQTYTLYNTTGGNTDGAITQDAITKIINSINKRFLSNIFNTVEEGFYITDPAGNILFYISSDGENNFSGSSNDEEKKAKKMKVLAIGNSFATDALAYVPPLLKEVEAESVIGFLYYPGCTLAQHVENWNSNSNSYTYYKHTGEKWTEQTSKSISFAIDDEDWDIVILQQESSNSGKIDTVMESLPEIIAKVKENIDGVKIGWLMTPAWGIQNIGWGTSTYQNQSEMYSAIVDVAKKVRDMCEVDFLIPVATAIQNARGTSLDAMGANLFASSSDRHLEDGIGRLIAALTVYNTIWKAITGKSLMQLSFLPIYGTNVVSNTSSNYFYPQTSAFEEVTKQIAIIAKACSNAAAEKMFEISDIYEINDKNI